LFLNFKERSFLCIIKKSLYFFVFLSLNRFALSDSYVIEERNNPLDVNQNILKNNQYIDGLKIVEGDIIQSDDL
jgi:hypothetical protein